MATHTTKPAAEQSDGGDSWVTISPPKWEFARCADGSNFRFFHDIDEDLEPQSNQSIRRVPPSPSPSISPVPGFGYTVIVDRNMCSTSESGPDGVSSTWTTVSDSGASEDASEDQNQTPRTDSGSSSQQCVPGCSAYEPNGKEKPPVFTNSMMQAYVAMRGPSMGGGATDPDPLFKWIGERDEAPKGESSKAKSEHKDITTMLENMDIALRSDNMGGDTPGDATFEMPKPQSSHITPPAGMDLSFHESLATAQDHNIPWNDGPDDEEGTEPCPRVTPCMFLAMSEDAQRWKREDLDAVLNAPISETRTRPEGPVERKNELSWFPTSIKTQCDEITGEEFSPQYSVPEDPSIIYTPPGVDDYPMAPPSFLGKYSRMAPMEAKKHRDYLHGKVQSDPKPAASEQKYTSTEVERATNEAQDIGAGFVSLAGPQVHGYLESQYRVIAEQEAADTALRAEIAEQEKRIQTLEQELEDLRYVYIPQLQQQRAAARAEREQKARETAEASRARRDKRIRDHVASHLCHAQERLDRVYLLRVESKKRRDENTKTIDNLKTEIDEECLLAGKSGPEGIYDELNSDDQASFVPLKWEPLTGASRETADDFSLRFPTPVPMPHGQEEEEEEEQQVQWGQQPWGEQQQSAAEQLSQLSGTWYTETNEESDEQASQEPMNPEWDIYRLGPHYQSSPYRSDSQTSQDGSNASDDEDGNDNGEGPSTKPDIKGKGKAVMRGSDDTIVPNYSYRF